MGRIGVHIALMAGAALMLAGCGFADIRSPVPEFMRAKAPDPPPLEAPPDIKTMLREKLDAVFTPASHPTHVRVSEPRHNLRGPGWTACVKAEVISVIGKPLGTQTYRIDDFRRRDLGSPAGRGRRYLLHRELPAGLITQIAGLRPVRRLVRLNNRLIQQLKSGHRINGIFHFSALASPRERDGSRRRPQAPSASKSRWGYGEVVDIAETAVVRHASIQGCHAGVRADRKLRTAG